MKLLRLFTSLLVLLPLVNNAQPAWLNDGLVAYYPFDGNAKDYSGNGYDGKVFGAIKGPNRFLNQGRSYQFKSSHKQYISVQDSEELQFSDTDFSISLWCFKNTSTHHPVLFKRNPGSIGWRLDVDNDAGVRWMVSGGGDPMVVSGTPLQIGSWHHICLSYSLKAKEMSIYINSEHVGNYSVRPPNSSPGIDMRIGGDSQGLYWFSGGLDDVRIYNRALSASEVSELYIWSNIFENQSSYEIIERRLSDNLSWSQAKVAAEKLGGHLVSIETRFENEILTEMLKNSGLKDKRVWIGGLQNDDKSWLWVNGSRPFYDNIKGLFFSPLNKGPNIVLHMNESGDWLWDNGSRNTPPWGRSYIVEFSKIRPALALAKMVSGFIVDYEIIDSGGGYITVPSVIVQGGNPIEMAQAEAVIEDGRLVGINITNAGSGYQEVPSIRIESPPSQAQLGIGISRIETTVPDSERPRRAIATANVINGFLVSADLVDGGLGYEQAPIVTVVDATGTGALAAATIENGVVTSVQFVKAGIGYSDKALIQFQSPPPNPDATPRVTEVELSMQLRIPNNYYVIEASSDLVNWKQVVKPFFAEETTHTVKVTVGDDDMRYFRAIQLP